MKRRALLQWIASIAAVVASRPMRAVRIFAQPRELPPAAIASLHEIAATVLPASLGADRIRAIADRFVIWTRDYREGVPLSHGYGHPRLQRSGPAPAPTYIAQLAALSADARARG